MEVSLGEVTCSGGMSKIPPLSIDPFSKAFHGTKEEAREGRTVEFRLGGSRPLDIVIGNVVRRRESPRYGAWWDSICRAR